MTGQSILSQFTLRVDFKRVNNDKLRPLKDQTRHYFYQKVTNYIHSLSQLVLNITFRSRNCWLVQIEPMSLKSLKTFATGRIQQI